jgi:hypothetical protein
MSKQLKDIAKAQMEGTTAEEAGRNFREFARRLVASIARQEALELDDKIMNSPHMGERK